MQPWERDQKERILRARPNCFICKKRQATELHHCLVHDSKKFHREVTVPENLMEVCGVCHTSQKQKANGHEMRLLFAGVQIERGYDIIKWYESLPQKVKESWIYNLKELVYEPKKHY